MKEVKFLKCTHCGNIVEVIEDAGVPIMCCGQKMEQLIPASVEASIEKHLPVVTKQGNTVKATVGSVTHPMTNEHNISWIYLQTDKGGMRKDLAPDSAPEVFFTVTDEKPLCVYAYCNLHGLWKTDI